MSFNLAVILSESARRTPDYPVAVFDGGQLTYRQLDQASDRVAASLAAAGIKPGERIALQLPNIPQFLISYFGILKAGAVVVPLNVLLRAPEIAYHLEDSGALILITWEGVLAEAAKGAEAAGIGAIFAVGHAAGAAGAMPFGQLLDGTAPPLEMVMRQPADTAVIVYTSGTTGQPKGAELTHIQLYMNADIPGRLFDVQPDDVVITVLPLFHVFGLSSILDVCVRFGCTMSLIPRFTPAAVLAAVQRDRATIFEGVPTMFADLLSSPDLDRYDLSSLRVAISGGASIPAPVLDAFEERFGLVILEGYGMTGDRVHHDLQPQRGRAPRLQRGQAHLGDADPGLGRRGASASARPRARGRGRHPRHARDEGVPEPAGGHRWRLYRRLAAHR